MTGNGNPFSPGDDKKKLPGGGGGGGETGRGRGKGRAAGHGQPQVGRRLEQVVHTPAVLSTRKQANAGVASVPPLSPFNSGRAVPSKWEDAERWICSPVSANNNSNSEHLLRNRPKSKSGPLGVGHPGNFFGYPGHLGGGFYSPVVPGLEGWSGRSFFAEGSPFSAGVFVADESLMMSCIGGTDNAIGGHRWLEERIDANEGMNGEVPRAVSRRDMATQMSPDSSVCTSPKTRTSRRHSPHIRLDETEDVLMDRRLNVISWSKRHAARFKMKDQAVPKDEFDVEVRASSSWDVRELGKSTSRVQRDEAKIAAWENLQKAKAEAAIRKLEMKLEKRRSSSIDRIQNKLRKAELKAQEMRCSISEEDRARNPTKEKRSHKRFRLDFLPRLFCCRSF